MASILTTVGKLKIGDKIKTSSASKWYKVIRITTSTNLFPNKPQKFRHITLEGRKTRYALPFSSKVVKYKK